MGVALTKSLQENYQEVRFLDPKEVAKRCCDVSAAVYAELRERDWLVDVPTYEEMRSKLENEGGSVASGFTK